VKAASAEDYRSLARRRLPKFLFEYIDGGAGAETTMRRNIADLQSVMLRQRVLRDVSKVSLEAELFGRRQAMPIALGPIGLGGLAARRGEAQAARAAERAGIPFCLSTVSLCPLGEVVRAVRDPFWFQLYVMRDRGFLREMLARAREAGCAALVFTVDMPVPGTRYRDLRSGLADAAGLAGRLRRLFQAVTRPAWAYDVGLHGRPHALGNVATLVGRDGGLADYSRWMRDNFDPSVTWREIEAVRAEWGGTFIIKGILDPEDAVRAAAAGADGVIVSNHGGRQLDGAPSSCHALPRVRAAVGYRLTVLADGGIRSGLDVVRMLALGADGVLLGRAWAYALGGGGGAGVTHLLDLFAAEMRVAMSLTGVTSVGEIDDSLLVR